MINHLSIIIIGINLLLLTKFQIVQTQKVKDNKTICIDDHSRPNYMDFLKICYINDIQNHSVLVWFTIKNFLNTFNSYRFILRSIDNELLSSVFITILTNFTELNDFENSLRILKLDLGQYEVCIEFQSNSSRFIYQPRDACILIKIGLLSYQTFKQDSTPILIALATGIVLFFILGLVVQWGQDKRRKKHQDDSRPRIRSTSILSTISLKQQRERFVQALFHRHIDRPHESRLRQWARNLAFRHRISTQEQDVEKPRMFKKWRFFFPSTNQSVQTRSRAETISQDGYSSEPVLTKNNINTISDEEHQQPIPRKVSFHLTPSEEFEIP